VNRRAILAASAQVACRAAARIAVLALACGVAGCAAPAADSHRVLTLMLPPSERPFWMPIARAFEREHPGVRVDLIEGPQSTDLREDLSTASLLAGDPTFDLV
jgi:multiple sugar transport system substrate-binding protein